MSYSVFLIRHSSRLSTRFLLIVKVLTSLTECLFSIGLRHEVVLSVNTVTNPRKLIHKDHSLVIDLRVSLPRSSYSKYVPSSYHWISSRIVYCVRVGRKHLPSFPTFPPDSPVPSLTLPVIQDLERNNSERFQPTERFVLFRSVTKETDLLDLRYPYLYLRPIVLFLIVIPLQRVCYLLFYVYLSLNYDLMVEAIVTTLLLPIPVNTFDQFHLKGLLLLLYYLVSNRSCFDVLTRVFLSCLVLSARLVVFTVSH